ncbi:MAG: hypothetical protein WA213_17625 [Terriglobales bacterium]
MWRGHSCPRKAAPAQTRRNALAPRPGKAKEEEEEEVSDHTRQIAAASDHQP